MKKVEPARRRKIWKRAGIVMALVLAGSVAAVPFVFTTGHRAGVRLAKAGVKGVTIGSASLMPWGELRLHDVTFLTKWSRLARRAAGKTLLAASMVRLGFAWSELPGAKFQAIAVEGVTANVRPGADAPVSLWQLISADAPAAATTSAPASMPGTEPNRAPLPIWFDSLTATGNVRVEGAPVSVTAAALPANANLPLRVSVRMTGDRQAPALEIAGNIGDVELAPALPMIAARVHLSADGIGVATLDKAWG